MARLILNAKGETELSNVTFNGKFPKATRNAVVSINDSEDVVIKNVNFADDFEGYNPIEIALGGNVKPKNILIDGCHFGGNLLNNAISIFGTQENAVININNCTVDYLANVFLRISNNTNVKNVTFNITNCTIKKWKSNDACIVMGQDYTSNAQNVDANNLFAPDKIKINITNLTLPSGRLATPEDISKWCGDPNNNCLVFIWLDAKAALAYDKDKFPELIVK